MGICPSHTNMQENLIVRLDKYLWAARFYKTRALATQAIDGGKVHLNGQRTKAAKRISVNDTVAINQGGILREIKVIALSDKRGPAKVAITLYEESTESIKRREHQLKQRKLAPRIAPKDKPDKRKRQKIRRFLGKE